MIQQVLIRQKIQQSDSQHSEFVLLAMNVITNNDKLTVLILATKFNQSYVHRRVAIYGADRWRTVCVEYQ